MFTPAGADDSADLRPKDDLYPQPRPGAVQDEEGHYELSGAGQLVSVTVERGVKGALGIGLNDSNRVVEPGPQSGAGLRAWDQARSAHRSQRVMSQRCIVAWMV